MSKILKYTAPIFLLLMLLSCEKYTAPETNYNPPEDHTISKEGKMHKPGLGDPETNCSNCHGSDLRGSETATSCYECHGKEW